MKKLMYVLPILIIGFVSCKKTVQVPLPSNLVTSDYVFNNTAATNSAMLGIYTVFPAPEGAVGNLGEYVDELKATNNSNSGQVFNSSVLLSTTSNVSSNWWKPYYNILYQANAVLQGVRASTALPDSVKIRITGEAEFCRAYAYLYLVNLFGDVPLITSTDVELTSKASRTNVNLIYTQIIDDLKDSETKLAGSYPGEEKIRATKWAATALLARVYLYMKDWTNAEIESSKVINSGSFTLLPDLNQVFLKNNDEVILQLWNKNGFSLGSFIPTTTTVIPSTIVSSSLVNSFADNDNRKASWLAFNTVNGVNYYYPFKYKAKSITTGTNAEYTTLLRLAEQFLIRAEAREHLNDLPNAIADLNQVHTRAGLSAYSTNHTVAQYDSLIQNERRWELFTENGHRFFDLKRTGLINPVMKALKPTWTNNADLLPIPLTEILIDPNLVQNPGY